MQSVEKNKLGEPMYRSCFLRVMCEALVTPGVTRWRRGQPGRVILYLKLMKLGRARFIPSLAGGMLAAVPGICTIIFSACYMYPLINITFIRYLRIGLCAGKSILGTWQVTALFVMWQGWGVAPLGLGTKSGIAYIDNKLQPRNYPAITPRLDIATVCAYIGLQTNM